MGSRDGSRVRAALSKAINTLCVFSTNKAFDTPMGRWIGCCRSESAGNQGWDNVDYATTDTFSEPTLLWTREVKRNRGYSKPYIFHTHNDGEVFKVG